jgi:hypothetical protein
VTPRNSPDFSSEGIIAAAVLGLTDSRYNTTKDLEFIPNMDGFPNGRRLEDDVTRIELQAVSGVALAAVGLWYDDRNIGSSPLSQDLLDVLTYTTGVESNDRMFQMSFPYLATPFSGFGPCGGIPAGTMPGGGTADLRTPMTEPRTDEMPNGLGFSSPKAMMKVGQNPFKSETVLSYHLPEEGHVSVLIYDMSGKVVKVLEDQDLPAGNYDLKWRPENATSGMYIARILVDGQQVQSLKLNYSK